MNWLKRLLGMEVQPPAPKPETANETTKQSSPKPSDSKRKKSKRDKTDTPASLARKFAKGIPGARVQTFASSRDDRLVARVEYSYEGAVFRLDIDLWEDGDFVVWLKTRCRGVFGAFELMRADEGEKPEDGEQHFFVTKECYVADPRMRNEVGRILTLPEDIRDRLIAVGKDVRVVSLFGEAMHVNLGDLSRLIELLEKPTGRQWLLSLGRELAFLGASLPPLAEDVAALAEARVCSFCGAMFVFAPERPRCTRCGAPATTASLMPPPTYNEIPDDPLFEADPDDPDDLRDRMIALREKAEEFARLVDEPSIREDPERARVYVEYSLDGRAFRVKLMEDYAGISTAASGALGDFYLTWSRQDVAGEINRSEPWHEWERKVFFSQHCRIRSDHTTKEAARLASLPSEARALLLELSEKYQARTQLADEVLALGLGEPGARSVKIIAECSRAVATIADSIPRDFNDQDVSRYALRLCGHCSWEYFTELAKPVCVHCGA